MWYMVVIKQGSYSLARHVALNVTLLKLYNVQLNILLINVNWKSISLNLVICVILPSF